MEVIPPVNTPSLDSASDSMICLMQGCEVGHTPLRSQEGYGSTPIW
ncbi:hypothetical protein SynBIOSU31_01231 [Synechococcus sp. BIOS-U3-1]|nr:hypothetical protein SynBIOSU31_01231 [Synechococcus sp. BIOS-U3-1]